MYPDQRDKLESDCRDGIARLADQIVAQRAEAHRIVAHAGFETQASVAGANAILAAMAKWEAATAEHRLQAARLVERGGPDDYVEQAMLATMELDQFLFWVRRTRAHLIAAQTAPALQQPMPAFQPPTAAPAGPPVAAGTTTANAGLSADYWKMVAELEKKEAKAAKAMREHSNSLSRQIIDDRLAQAGRHSAAVRSIL